MDKRISGIEDNIEEIDTFVKGKLNLKAPIKKQSEYLLHYEKSKHNNLIVEVEVKPRSKAQKTFSTKS